MTLSVIDLWLTFVTALLASGHCIGMCGGMVAAYSLKLSRKTLFFPHLLYGVGRLFTYGMLGAVSGWIGSLSFTLDRPDYLQGAPYLLAGVVMVWMGLDTLGLLRFVGRQKEAGLFERLSQRVIQRIERGKTLVLGMITGLLPCTLHWAFQAKAMALGSVSGGVATLLAFGLGTLPALWGFGLVSTWLSHRARHRLLQGAALVIVIMGLMTIKRGL
ncbi:MAG: sulfite exporter TauE/SafE family protein [Magnetococcales bacterium]|nr:sulfite exporter TauE/SafE family protein [Magnetococcales bacterium]